MIPLLMELTLSIPALLFPAISLTMLAYNARYLAIAALIRQLHKEYIEKENMRIIKQINLLKKRLFLIRNMQASAILSFLGAVATMGLLYIEAGYWAHLVFGVSLVALLISLVLSLIEVQLSTKALSLQLSTIKDRETKV